MAVFACNRCGSPLTGSLRFGLFRSERYEATVDRGHYSVDPNPAWTQYDGRTGVLVAAASTNCIVTNPEDVHGVRWSEADGSWSGCCGPDGHPTDNLVCASCAAPIGTLFADCWTAFEIRLEPDRVARVPDEFGVRAASGRPAWFEQLDGDPVGRRLEPDEDPEESAEGQADDWDDDDDGDGDGDYDTRMGLWHLAVHDGRVFLPAGNAPLVAVIDGAEMGIEALIELPNAAVGMEAARPRWGIPFVAAGAGTVWISDVTAPGLFAIDTRSLEVRGRVAIEGEDDRTPGAAPGYEVVANDSATIATGRNQGDLAVVDPLGLEVTKLVRVGRSLEGLCLDGTTIWVGDVFDESLRRVDGGGGVTPISLDSTADAVRAAFGSVWAVGSTNVINDIGRLYRVDPARAELTTTVHLGGMPETVCPTDELALGRRRGADRVSPTRTRRSCPRWTTSASVTNDWVSRTLLTAFEPNSLDVVTTSLVAGQLHDLAWDGTWLWAVVFSPDDQADCLIRIDPVTGDEDQRLVLTDVDVSHYNPREPEPVPLAASAFNASVRDAVEPLLRRSGPAPDVTVEVDATGLVVPRWTTRRCGGGTLRCGAPTTPTDRAIPSSRPPSWWRPSPCSGRREPCPSPIVGAFGSWTERPGLPSAAMADFETVLYEETDGVAWVTLNRPEVHNAFNFQMQEELKSIWRGLRTNDDVDCRGAHRGRRAGVLHRHRPLTR